MPPYAGEFDTVPTEEVGSVAVDSVEPTKLLTESMASTTKVEGKEVVEEDGNDNTETDMDSVNDDDHKSTGDDSSTAASAVGNAFEMLMDFNPCMAMQSAVFKVRNCNYCGEGCSKVRCAIPACSLACLL